MQFVAHAPKSDPARAAVLEAIGWRAADAEVQLRVHENAPDEQDCDVKLEELLGHETPVVREAARAAKLKLEQKARAQLYSLASVRPWTVLLNRVPRGLQSDPHTRPHHTYEADAAFLSRAPCSRGGKGAPKPGN